MLKNKKCQTKLEKILTTEILADVTVSESELAPAKALADLILETLDENSAQDIINIDISGKSSVADFMIVASGRSNRHVNALADYVLRSLKDEGLKDLGVEGLDASDWVLVDAGDVILHIFRPEVRQFYNLEKIWSLPLPESLREASGMEHPLEDQ